MSDALDDGDDIKEAEFLDGGVSLEEECERLTDSAGSLHARDGWSACRGWGSMRGGVEEVGGERGGSTHTENSSLDHDIRVCV